MVTLAAGVTGVVVAHVVAYVLAFSNPSQRAHVLRDTGHGYFSIAVWAGLAAGALAVAVVVARAAAGEPDSRPNQVVPPFGALALWQGCLFLAVEVSERLAAGAPLAEMVHSHELLIGLAVELLVAAAVVLVLGGTALVTARLAAALRRPRFLAVRDARSPRPRGAAPVAVRRTGIRSRAPPAPWSAIS
jgi:hypothetical protein